VAALKRPPASAYGVGATAECLNARGGIYRDLLARKGCAGTLMVKKGAARALRFAGESLGGLMGQAHEPGTSRGRGIIEALRQKDGPGSGYPVRPSHTATSAVVPKATCADSE
jgi:hypothetical protein